VSSGFTNRAFPFRGSPQSRQVGTSANAGIPLAFRFLSIAAHPENSEPGLVGPGSLPRMCAYHIIMVNTGLCMDRTVSVRHWLVMRRH
jgi:hypothetical protein